MPEVIENQSRATAKTLLNAERRRPRRSAHVNPQLDPLLRDPVADGSPPKGGSVAKRAPSKDVNGETPERQIMDFLVGHRGKPVCDDCLKQQVHHAMPPEIATALKAIGVAFGFRKVTEPCICCGKTQAGIKAR